jgi:putative ABC transport system substrate-binding protein
MRTRRELLLSIGIAAGALPFRALAQKDGKVWRVGFLSARLRPASLDGDYHGGFPLGMRELGYVEGKNLTIEWRYAGGDYDRLPSLAKELADLRVDAIVTADGTPSALAAKNATRTIPVVFAAAGDPVGAGLVASLPRPGGNVTGISLVANETNLKQMEMLGAIAPRLSLLGVLWNPTNPFSGPAMKSFQDVARLRHLNVLEVAVHTPAEIEEAFVTFVRERVSAVSWVTDAFLIQQRQQIADLAVKRLLPSVGGLREYAEAGGLLSYGPNRTENYRRAAVFVDKILRGAKPADLPVEQPTKLELVINRKTAKALGLTIPPDLLVLADKVIE